jgi:pyruvate-ferredoxin/flavodoxin oxidoreductase
VVPLRVLRPRLRRHVSARTRTRSRSSARTPTTSRRATSCTTRRRPAPSPSPPAIRAAPDPLDLPDRTGQANFVACHQPELPRPATTCWTRRRLDGGDLPAQQPGPPTRLWDSLPRKVQQQIIDKQMKVYVIDAYGSPRRPAWAPASTPSCRPASSRSRASCPATRRSRRSRTRSRRRTEPRARRSSSKNFIAVDQTLANLHEVTMPGKVDEHHRAAAAGRQRKAPEYVRDVTSRSSPAAATTSPSAPSSATAPSPPRRAKWEKRSIALEIPVWDEDVCIQCGKCALVCPHAAIRTEDLRPVPPRDRAGDLQERRLPAARTSRGSS